ncbi:MAG: PAS domain-containing protein, partial [bacterium]|nr:PAS domain-containing protein [bacterium]
MKERGKVRGAGFTNTEAILESISDGVFTVDKDWRVTSFNRSAEEITG